MCQLRQDTGNGPRLQLRHEPNQGRRDGAFRESQYESCSKKATFGLNQRGQTGDEAKSKHHGWNPDTGTNLLAENIEGDFGSHGTEGRTHDSNGEAIANKSKIFCHAEDSGIANVTAVDEVEDVDDNEEDHEMEVKFSDHAPDQSFVADNNSLMYCG